MKINKAYPQIVNKPVPLHSKLPTATPQCRRSQLNNIARWITKIDRTPTFGPVNLSFDRDSSLTQLLPSRVKVLRLCSERHVPSPLSPVGRNIPPRCSALARIKNQQNPTATSENRSPIATLYHFQSQRVVIKPLRSGQIRRIQNRLKDSAWLHCNNSRIAPPNDPSSATAATRGGDCNRSAMPPFAAAHGWAAFS